ncbi:hypothetical protein [Ekhidna sp. To15]|uniref:hypothetical protein n=1 Tax=Ekhidna sp. To15 TaxID=3395267 RepID=UPI003F527478
MKFIKKPKVLFLSDLYYEANGRDYYKEDLLLTHYLKDEVDLIIAHPSNSQSFEEFADLIIIRNTGPIEAHQKQFDQFKNRVHQKGLKTINSLDGKADINGKNYLPLLFEADFPVIPSISNPQKIDLLPSADYYLTKPILGADSHGILKVKKEDVSSVGPEKFIIQPFVEIQEEHSLFFVDDEFLYALKTTTNRWRLFEFSPNNDELKVAMKFISWNNMESGIQRVDLAVVNGDYFLVELEDINPFLSLENLTQETLTRFIKSFLLSIKCRLEVSTL